MPIRPTLVTLMGAAAWFIGIVLVEQILAILAAYVSETVGWTATNRLCEDLALHCLQLDLGFHKSHTPGEMIERLDGDVNNLAHFFSQFTLNLLTHLMLLLGILVLLWQEEWRIGLAITVIAGLGLVALNHIRGLSVPYWRAMRQASAHLFGFLEEQFNSTEDIRANGATDYVLRRLYRHMRRLYQHEFQARLRHILGLMLPILVFGLAYIAAFLLGNQSYAAGMSIGTIYLIFYYLELLSAPLWQIVNEVEDLQKAGASISRIDELNRLRSRIQDGPGVPLPSGPLAVSFAAVSFHYEDSEEAVLQDITFRLEPGEVLGVMGRTGSGKTTLTRLLFRLYDPVHGSVCLGDGRTQAVDIRLTHLAELRRRVAMVTQEVQLFPATVRDNLTFFDSSVSDERLLTVIRELGLADWLSTLPSGLDTMLAGSSLSAGQAQLLALGRVFLQDPGLVILDEASSRLDPSTERLIEQAVGRLLHGRTAIIIAHRMETVQRADKLLILHNGRIGHYGQQP